MVGLGKYPGGKTRAARWILPYLPHGFRWYVEPFCGNAPFLNPKFRHYIDPSEVRVWLNDLDVLVYNVLTALRESPAEFIDDFLSRRERCKSAIGTRVQFETAKLDTRLDKDPAAYLLLRRLAVHEVVRAERLDMAVLSIKYARPNGNGYPDGLCCVNRDRLIEGTETAGRLARVTNLDFREVLRRLPANACIYADPTYHGPAVDRIYNHILTENDHEDLRDMLAALNPATHRFLMSLEISELSHDLYIADGHFCWKRIPVLYSNRQKQSKRTWEYLIANYPL